jgi:acyl homoserine lactone synthase
MKLLNKETNFFVHFTNESELLASGFKLRHKIFAEYLKWVPVNSAMQEIDSYDEYASHLVVRTQENDVVGYLRIIRGWDGIFMLQEYFLIINPFGNEINHPDSTEITRFCISPSLSFKETRQVITLLYKACYQWLLEHKISTLRVVVIHQYFEVLRMEGFLFKIVSETDKFSSQFRTIYAQLSLTNSSTIDLESIW